MTLLGDLSIFLLFKWLHDFFISSLSIVINSIYGICCVLGNLKEQDSMQQEAIEIFKTNDNTKTIR